MACSKCGRECEGTYCDSCRFYETNEQCWRCRMYLPKIELQQWRGQIYCPYCIMDLRDSEKGVEDDQADEARRSRRDSGDSGTPPGGTPFAASQKSNEKWGYSCDRCNNELDVAYVVADHKFCEACFQQQQRVWKKHGTPQPAYLKCRIKEDPGIFTKFIRFLKRKVNREWEQKAGQEAEVVAVSKAQREAAKAAAPAQQKEAPATRVSQVDVASPAPEGEIVAAKPVQSKETEGVQPKAEKAEKQREPMMEQMESKGKPAGEEAEIVALRSSLGRKDRKRRRSRKERKSEG